MILLCELAIKYERTCFLPTLDNEITAQLLSFSLFLSLLKNLTSCAKICSSGPLFCSGAMGRIPVTLTNILKYRLDCQLARFWLYYHERFGVFTKLLHNSSKQNLRKVPSSFQ